MSCSDPINNFWESKRNNAFIFLGFHKSKTSLIMKHILTIQKAILIVATFFVASSAWAQIGNTVEGVNAGVSLTTGDLNSFFGENAGRFTDAGSRNSFFGYGAGQSNTLGINNSFFGQGSGFSNTEGTWNTFIGRHAGYANSTGKLNTFVGGNAGRFTTTGENNVFLGVNSGYRNITGSNNVFIGYRAGFNEKSSNKLYIDNSSTSFPLIKGDFSTNELLINGTVGIGFAQLSLIGGPPPPTIPTGYKLAVDGKIIAEEIKVKLSQDWPDYVFAPEYEKPTLEDLEESIETIGHLPNMPSAEEVEANGYLLGEMDVKLLEKIEELTLYVIDLNKEMKEVKAKNIELETALQSIGQ